MLYLWKGRSAFHPSTEIVKLLKDVFVFTWFILITCIFFVFSLNEVSAKAFISLISQIIFMV